MMNGQASLFTCPFESERNDRPILRQVGAAGCLTPQIVSQELFALHSQDRAKVAIWDVEIGHRPAKGDFASHLPRGLDSCSVHPLRDLVWFRQRSPDFIC